MFFFFFQFAVLSAAKARSVLVQNAISCRAQYYWETIGNAHRRADERESSRAGRAPGVNQVILRGTRERFVNDWADSDYRMTGTTSDRPMVGQWCESSLRIFLIIIFYYSNGGKNLSVIFSLTCLHSFLFVGRWIGLISLQTFCQFVAIFQSRYRLLWKSGYGLTIQLNDFRRVWSNSPQSICAHIYPHMSLCRLCDHFPSSPQTPFSVLTLESWFRRPCPT